MTAHNSGSLARVAVFIIVVFQFFAWQKGGSSITIIRNLSEEKALAVPPDVVAPDTAILISSSWIPTHPSTEMMEKVLDSIHQYLEGLPPSTPIFILVDYMRVPTAEEPSTKMEEFQAKQATLDDYVTNLYTKFLTHPNIHVIPSLIHWHIGGTVLKALNLIEELYPEIEFLYYLQHDLSFIRSIDHIGLTQILQQHPNDVNYVRFRRKTAEREVSRTDHSCPYHKGALGTNLTTYTAPQGGNATIFASGLYSDNNHFVRLSWYRSEVMEAINGNQRIPGKASRRTPEGPLMYRAGRDCQSLKLFTYGHEVDDGEPHIQHLDGRCSQSDDHENCHGRESVMVTKKQQQQ